MFIGRTTELSFLNDRYNSNKAEFITVYGRRRVGKTELLTEFCKDKPNIFYACNEYTDKKQFEVFSEALLDYDYSSRKLIKRFTDWADAFSHLADIKSDKKLVVVIDEFPYMAKANKSIPSILQNLWDHTLCKANIMFIISGSSISFIEDELLASKNPLYGRMTGIYKLEPLPFDDAVKFFPDYSNEDKLLAYSILGGIPHYLKQFDAALSLQENIKKNILTKGTVLFGEVEYILHQELREPAAYNTILEAVALGNCRFNEICDKTHIESNNISVYLKSLLELGLIMREFPIMTSSREVLKKNQGEYRIADSFFRFWYAYAYQYMSELARGDINAIWKNIIEKDLHHFASKAFENVSIDYLCKLNNAEQLPFWFAHIGRWWGNVNHKDEDGKLYSVSEEVDMLAVDKEEKNFIVGECKFTNESFDLSQLKAVKQKLNLNGTVYYYLFSLNGFTEAVQKEASNTVSLVALSDILK